MEQEDVPDATQEPIADTTMTSEEDPDPTPVGKPSLRLAGPPKAGAEVRQPNDRTTVQGLAGLREILEQKKAKAVTTNPLKRSATIQGPGPKAKG